MIHSSSLLDEWFQQRFADLQRRSTAYAIFIYGNFILNNPYFLLLPYMETKKNHTFYCLFDFKKKQFFSLLSLSDQLALSKMYSKKILVPITIISQKIKQELGDLFGSKNPTRGYYTSNRAFNY